MKQLRKRLTYANVMSSIAVFLVLGGASAFAATQLAKNSVGSKQLKKNAVTTAKIKNNAVTTAKIRNGAITGAKVNLGSLGTVPNATHAGTADSATSAGNANTVGGLSVKKFFYAVSSPSPAQAVVTVGGLTINASCIGGTLEAWATTSISDALVHSSGVSLTEDKAFYDERDGFDPGETADIFPSTGGDSVQGQITYATPGGQVATADFTGEEEDLGTFDCALVGTAIG